MDKLWYDFNYKFPSFFGEFRWGEYPHILRLQFEVLDFIVRMKWKRFRKRLREFFTSSQVQFVHCGWEKNLFQYTFKVRVPLGPALRGTRSEHTFSSIDSRETFSSTRSRTRTQHTFKEHVLKDFSHSQCTNYTWLRIPLFRETK